MTIQNFYYLFQISKLIRCQMNFNCNTNYSEYSIESKLLNSTTVHGYFSPSYATSTSTIMQLPRVSEFFKDQKVFITGGSGFIGKVFIEKLLRSCPDVHSVYLLMRPKKGKTVEERIKDITDVPLFDILRKHQPDFEKKIKVIVGDTTEIGLGLNDEDRQFLIDEINSIFHIAATIRFDTSLAEAIFTNTRGTRDLALLALEMKQLRVFQYVSTAYSNSDHKVIEEKVYPAHADWRKTIEICEKLEKVDIMAEKYIKPLHNCYTFSKHLAECVVNDLLVGKVPVVILRPSIVVPTYTDPFPGWIDTFNSPVSLMIGMATGIIKIVYTRMDVEEHYIPVDIVVKDMILSTWQKYYERNNKEEILVINSAFCDFLCITTKKLYAMGDRLNETVPMERSLWAYNCSFTTFEYYFYLQFMIFQFLPALMIDGIARLLGKKPFLVKLQRKIYNNIHLIKPFTFNRFEFKVKNALALEKSVLQEDKGDFKYMRKEGDPFEYIVRATEIIKRFLLHQYDDKAARRNLQKMKRLNYIVKTLFFLLVVWLIFIKFGALEYASRQITEIYNIGKTKLI